ncbi:hypothetical protein EC968_003919 [Mortierella alpina]|nr:hypothetical protein EC968_003919 [Mortierella alpina]
MPIRLCTKRLPPPWLDLCKLLGPQQPPLPCKTFHVALARSFHPLRAPHTRLNHSVAQPDHQELSTLALKPKGTDFRLQLDKSLSKLAIKDLTILLETTGQPLTGTKPILINRLATYLTSIIRKIESISKPISEATTSCDLSVQQIKAKILPQSIVSIDIGVRNLAWVELSREGEILRWSIEDMLIPAKLSDPATSPKTQHADPTPSASETSSVSPSSKRTSKSRKRDPAPPYDPRTVAIRLDEVMRTIMNSGSVQGVIIERQRFRTGGMHAVLDVTFKCGVIEGMIHTWLAFWQHDWNIKNQARLEPDQHEASRVKDREAVFIESVPPRAVATWWGIGASSRRSPASSEPVLDDEKGSANSGKRPPEEKKEYSAKKGQSRAIVDAWINHDTAVRDLPTCLKVKCNDALKDWYNQEKKRDDLSDCLLQAVAWFEWKGRAIEEAVEWFREAPA